MSYQLYTDWYPECVKCKMGHFPIAICPKCVYDAIYDDKIFEKIKQVDESNKYVKIVNNQLVELPDDDVPMETCEGEFLYRKCPICGVLMDCRSFCYSLAYCKECAIKEILETREYQKKHFKVNKNE